MHHALSLLLSAVTIGGVASQCQAPVYWPMPTSWPVQHYHEEIEYAGSGQTYGYKRVHYDFVNSALRYDMTYLSGPQVPLITVLNMTSLWINTTLSIYTWAVTLDSTPNCVQLQMGFGIMYPDWFSAGANQSGLVWNAKKSDSFDVGYHRTLMSVKDAGQGTPIDDEVFTYYSYADSENFTENGAPFLMHAPSPAGMVVNEYYEFVPRSYAAGDPTFDLPTSPACIPAGFASSPEEAHAILSNHGAHLAKLPIVEIGMGFLGKDRTDREKFLARK